MYHKQIRSVIRLGVVLFTLLPMIFLSSPSSAKQVVGKPPLVIVQIGDSYSAGNGARSAADEPNYYDPSGCYQSPTNWGRKTTICTSQKANIRSATVGILLKSNGRHPTISTVDNDAAQNRLD